MPIKYLKTKKVEELLSNPGEKDLTEEIVKVSVEIGKMKLDYYLLKEEITNIKHLKMDDFCYNGEVFVGGQLPKMRLKTTYDKNSKISKELEELEL